MGNKTSTTNLKKINALKKAFTDDQLIQAASMGLDHNKLGAVKYLQAIRPGLLQSEGAIAVEALMEFFTIKN